MFSTFRKTVESAVETQMDHFSRYHAADLDEVTRPTPEDRYFTPAGWPESPAPKIHPEPSQAWEVPPPLIDPEDSSAVASVGELRVEILQATLPGADNMLHWRNCDSYAVALFERYAAQTAVHYNTNQPTWGVGTPRALRLPVSCCFSTLFVALRDKDSMSDDDLGRVVIRIATLTPGTVYDVWYPLQRSNLKKHASKRGKLRLRLTITYPDERARMLQYFTMHPERHPKYVVSFNSTAALKSAIFAYRGAEYHGRKYRWDVLRSHICELQATVEALESRAFDLFTWNRPMLSTLALVGWQLLVQFPKYLLAAAPMVFLVSLTLNMILKKPRAPIARQPSVCSLMLTLLFNRRAVPLTIEGSSSAADAAAVSTNQLPDYDSDAFSEGDEPTERWMSEDMISDTEESLNSMLGISDLLEAAAALSAGYVRVAIEGLVRSSKGKQRSLTQEKRILEDRATNEIDEEIESEWDKALETEEGRAKRLSTRMLYRIANPLSVGLSECLAPLQFRLGGFIKFTRSVHRAFMWEDNIMTLWIYLTLLALTVALVFVGELLSYVPWGWVLQTSMRLLGLALLGPHMYYVGQHLKRQWAEEKALASEFDSASAQRRAQILKTLEDEVLEKARLERLHELEEASSFGVQTGAPLPKHGLIIRTQVAAQRHKYLSRAEVHRSVAYPMTKSDEGAVSGSDVASLTA